VPVLKRHFGGAGPSIFYMIHRGGRFCYVLFLAAIFPANDVYTAFVCILHFQRAMFPTNQSTVSLLYAAMHLYLPFLFCFYLSFFLVLFSLAAIQRPRTRPIHFMHVDRQSAHAHEMKKASARACARVRARSIQRSQTRSAATCHVRNAHKRNFVMTLHRRRPCLNVLICDNVSWAFLTSHAAADLVCERHCIALARMCARAKTLYFSCARALCPSTGFFQEEE